MKIQHVVLFVDNKLPHPLFTNIKWVLICLSYGLRKSRGRETERARSKVYILRLVLHDISHQDASRAIFARKTETK